MKRYYVSPEEAETLAVGERLLASLRERNARLRARNDQLAGRRPRPELRVIQGGKTP
jgi:hypothetical protein